MKRNPNPFFAGRYFGLDSFYVDAASRLDKLKGFSAAECRAALKLPDLQKAVRLAIEQVKTRYGLQGGLWKKATELLIRNY